MNTVTVDAKTWEQLKAGGGTIQVKVVGDQLVGRLPVDDLAERYRAATGEEMPTDEELDRIQREEPSYSVEQVMERLRRLTKCS